MIQSMLLYTKRLARCALAILRSAKPYYYDSRRFLTAALFTSRNNISNTEHRLLALDSHVIEKGLSMAEMKTRFGQAKVTKLKELVLRKLAQPQPVMDTHLRNAIHALCDYFATHNKLGVDISDIISDREYEQLKEGDRGQSPATLEINREDLFANAQESFKDFASSRHSIRQFTDEKIPIEILQDIVQLANTAPSVCNRQTCRVHFYQDCEHIQRLLSLQTGNRGFGHGIQNLAIITSDMEFFVGTNERNQPFIDGGIYLMNFLYSSLHYKIGTVPLNWAVLPRRDKKLQKIARIPKNERIICLVGMGHLTEQFSIPASRKSSHHETLHVK